MGLLLPALPPEAWAANEWAFEYFSDIFRTAKCHRSAALSKMYQMFSFIPVLGFPPSTTLTAGDVLELRLYVR